MLSGCSGDGTVAVHGTISFKNRGVPEVCRIFFKPIANPGSPTRPSTAEVQQDGTYRAHGFRDSVGLAPGDYLISVTYYDLKPGGNPDSESGWQEANFDAGRLSIAADAGEIEHNIEIP